MTARDPSGTAPDNTTLTDLLICVVILFGVADFILWSIKT